MRQFNTKGYELYVRDPRLSMTLPGRLFVRIAANVSYVLFIMAGATFLLTGLPWLRAIGGFLFIFFVDRVMHRGQADRPLDEFPKLGKVNVAQYIRPGAFSVIERAFDRSVITKRSFYLEMTRELLHFSDVKRGLERLDVKPDEFRQKAEELLSGSTEPGTKKDLVAKAEALVLRALPQAFNAGHLFVEVNDLFVAMPGVREEGVSRLFTLFSVEEKDLEKAMIFGELSKRTRRLPNTVAGFVLHAPRIRHRIMNRAWTSRPTPTLDKYATDLTDLARVEEVGFLVGHEAEFDRLVEVLARPINPNAILVGDAGIGKESIVTYLALCLEKDEVPAALFDKRLVALELENLVAGAPQEELTKRLKRIVDEIMVAGNIIVYIPNIHNLVRTGGTAYLSAADALMPVLMSNSFPVVGATFPRDYKQYIEPRSDFAGAFETIRVNEVTEEQAERILSYESLILETKFRVTISFGAVKKAVTLAKKYFRNKFLPSSAEELLKSAIVDAEQRGEKTIGPDRIIAVAESKINIPMHEAGDEEAKKLLNLEQVIHERLVDQEEAVKAVADALREYRSGLARPGGPIASFLFVGPTGVGKTELAKLLSKVQFGSEKQMVRFDMTEYQDKQSFYRFIGSPDGTTSGALTDAILQKPYSLILLDEFEKAYPDILNLFLQVFDDGRLTDNLSRTVDFQNTIIIATSNAHSDIINDALNQGQTMSQIEGYLKKKLTDVFKPELLNRFSRIVIFKNLALKDLEKIVILNLQDIVDMVRGKGLTLEFDPAVITQFAKWGYDPAFGARPLRRVVDEKLRAPLAQAILEKRVRKGSRVKVVLRGEVVDFVSVD
ncbi:MAG: hypothetical protein A2945_02425 [Candidatus Liptonbacteria bacterium RIFCSPLOWO2_01_FULL_52_25]|uniref:Sigma-54 factor interaction domain-containing protein n=1 Tax=Candidatus Liptonbacteria bacterium RIFCSPLOWO2_01_FULL_52_25 TaxID=1798650 RepID=A0A1G2CHD8_9BACT|nr:MAG: hypothetical protein A2945_02425 [Candidatus Liptonbacteria bacterium RIFCSPLOWO2_01_FULL_52_25]